MSVLIDGYDTALFDLDGVVYLGEQAAPGVPSTLNQLTTLGKTVMYITNNAARPAAVVVEHLTRLGVQAEVGNVLTSAQVAAAALTSDLAPGAKILVCGTASLSNLLASAGFQIVESADQQPDAVVQGYDPDLNWRRLDEATLAIQGGARWYATNPDASRPTERGLVPGVGGAIAVIATAIGGSPTVFGKPYRPMLLEALRRTQAKRAIFVGDRLDTDIIGANAAGIDSLMVFSGTHGKADLLAAEIGAHPSCIAPDVSALLEPIRSADMTSEYVACGEQRVSAVLGRVKLLTDPGSRDEQFDALWAMTQLVWRESTLDYSVALAALDLVP